MKKVVQYTACALAGLMLVLGATGCTDQAYNSYDRTGEPYDYYLPDYVNVCDYKGIKVPNISYTPSEKDIENQRILELAVYSPFTKDVERGCMEGDRVVISTTCYVNDEVYEYLTFETNSQGEGHSFILGTNEFDIPQLEEAITGMKKGEDKEITFTFPDPYYRDILKSGKEATIEVHIDRVDEIDRLEDTEEFYEERLGTTREAREIEIRSNLQKRYDQYLQSYKITLTWQYLLDNSKLLEVPEKEYDEKYETMLDSYRSMAEDASVSLEEYVKDTLGYADIDAFYDFLEETAEQECYGDMILYYIARCEDLNFDDAYYESALLSYGEQYELTDAADVEDFLAYYNQLTDFQETTRYRYVQEWVADQAEVLEDVTTINSSKLK